MTVTRGIELTMARKADKPGGPAAGDDADRALVDACLSGDGRSFARLMERHEAAVSAWMWRFSRDRAELPDLVQEVFVEVYLSLDSFKGKSSLRTWMLAIATRVGYRSWKKKARAKKHRDEAAEWMRMFREERDAAEPSVAAEAIHRLLELLPPKERLALTLFYFEDMGVDEIAEMTGWSRSLVKVRSFRARRRLKDLLEEEGFGGESHV